MPYSENNSRLYYTHYFTDLKELQEITNMLKKNVHVNVAFLRQDCETIQKWSLEKQAKENTVFNLLIHFLYYMCLKNLCQNKHYILILYSC